MVGEGYLLDTSALYPLVLGLRERLLGYSSLFYVLDLTFYEVGNVLWKEYRMGRIKKLDPVVSLFEEVLRQLNVVRVPPGGIDGILSIAVGEGLTFYDASYLYMARTRGLRLVTEDSRLKRFPEAVGVGELVKELAPP